MEPKENGWHRFARTCNLQHESGIMEIYIYIYIFFKHWYIFFYFVWIFFQCSFCKLGVMKLFWNINCIQYHGWISNNFFDTASPSLHSRYSDCLQAGRSRGWRLSPGRVKNFLFSTSSRSALGSTQPRIQWVTEVLSLGVKWPGREANRSPLASAEVKKMWICTSTPWYAYMA
jgi:hypothetical protein